MLFNSYEFMFFFPIVLLIYFIFPKKIRYIWLLAASYYFYMSWNPKYAILIAISTVITYFSGILLQRAKEREKESWKKWIVAGSFVSNLGILAFFKYFDFLFNNANMVLEKLGISILQKPFDIILPVGISFYTFQALSYTMDVYHDKVSAEKNLLKYMLFVSFFPQLVAGPIERSENLLKQVREAHLMNLWNFERISNGIILMLWGYFQKLVIADRASIFVDAVYSEYWMYGSVELILATVLFAVQIYCDFASYSLIAIGAAKIMGFELMENFNAPYFAASIKDFWRRWHISLSTWFRDYLYIPLGGSRCSTIKKYRNLMITFLISGLWHGASWSFVVWGGIHGIYQIIGDLLKPVREKIKTVLHVKTNCLSYRLGQIIMTFMMVCFAWIFFRMNSLMNSLSFIKRIFVRMDLWVLHDKSIYTIGLNQTQMSILFFSLLALLLVDLVRYKKNCTIDIFLKEQNIWFRWGIVYLLLFTIIIYGVYGPEYDASSFIYFQF